MRFKKTSAVAAVAFPDGNVPSKFDGCEVALRVVKDLLDRYGPLITWACLIAVFVYFVGPHLPGAMDAIAAVHHGSKWQELKADLTEHAGLFLVFAILAAYIIAVLVLVLLVSMAWHSDRVQLLRAIARAKFNRLCLTVEFVD